MKHLKGKSMLEQTRLIFKECGHSIDEADEVVFNIKLKYKKVYPREACDRRYLNKNGRIKVDKKLVKAYLEYRKIYKIGNVLLSKEIGVKETVLRRIAIARTMNKDDDAKIRAFLISKGFEVDENSKEEML
jgi:hypothetical protein